MLIVLDHIGLTSLVDRNTAPIAPFSSIATQRQSHRTDQARLHRSRQSQHSVDRTTLIKQRLHRSRRSQHRTNQAKITPDLMNFFVGFVSFVFVD